MTFLSWTLLAVGAHLSCDILDGDLVAFREQRTLLLLRVRTTVPASVLTSNGASCLS